MELTPESWGKERPSGCLWQQLASMGCSFCVIYTLLCPLLAEVLTGYAGNPFNKEWSVFIMIMPLHMIPH